MFKPFISDIPSGFKIDNKFIQQNICLYDIKIKLIVIGDNQSNKQSIINAILNKHSANYDYQSNINLDINKTLVSYKNKIIEIELFDINEKLMQSNIINIYYQLSNSLIYIINPINLSTEYINNLTTKIQNIKKISKDNIKISLAVNIESMGNNLINDSFKDLAQKLNITLLYYKSDSFDIDNQMFIQFIDNIIFKN